MTRIKRVEGLGSPAAIRHDGICNTVMVDADLWDEIPVPQRRFIMLHELAHCNHDVYSEHEADEIAFRQFLSQGGNPEDAMKAITENLPGNPGVSSRLAQLHHILNEPMCNQCNTSYLGGGYSPQLDLINPLENGGYDGSGIYPPAGGNSGSDSDSDSDSTNAGSGGKFWDALGAVANTVGIALGSNRNRQPGNPAPTPQPQNNSTGWLIGGAAVLLLVVLFFVAKRKK